MRICVTNRLEFMRLSLLSQKHLPQLPSGSVMECVPPYFYVLGDDCNTLFVLDRQAEIIEKRPFFVSDFGGGRIPKPLKSDLEAGMCVEVGSEIYLLAFGSGSKGPERDTAFLIPLLADEQKIQRINLSDFYETLRQHPAVRELNIEGACQIGEKWLLFQRGGIFQPNLVFVCAPFAWEGQTPQPHALLLNLPPIAGIASGVSGAAYDATTDTLWLSASAEDTPDSYQDGEIKGSLIAKIVQASTQLRATSWTVGAYCLLEQDPPLKIESLCLHNGSLFTIADNDDGSSVWSEFRVG